MSEISKLEKLINQPNDEMGDLIKSISLHEVWGPVEQIRDTIAEELEQAIEAMDELIAAVHGKVDADVLSKAADSWSRLDILRSYIKRAI